MMGLMSGFLELLVVGYVAGQTLNNASMDVISR